MTIEQYIWKNIASRKLKLLMDEKKRIDNAMNKSTLKDVFILNNPVFLQKETEEVLKEAGYVFYKGVNGVRYCKEKNYDLSFSKSFNDFITKHLAPYLKVEDLDDDLPENETERYKKQKAIVEEAIVNSINSWEDDYFRFKTLRIEFSLDFSSARLHKSLYDELEKVGFVIENSCIGIAPVYTAQFKTNF